MRLPNGYGSVYKLSGKRRKPYVAKITTGWNSLGKQIYLTLGYFETKQDGLNALAEYHKEPSLFKSRSLTLEDIYNMWWKQKESQISNSTIVAYNSAWKNCTELHKENFSDIRLVHLQNCMDKLGDKYGAKRDLKALWSQIYDYAIANDMGNRKYTSYLNLGKHVAKTTHKPFTNGEIQTLWDNIDRMDYIDVILIYIYTGLRPIELLEIKRENVNLEEKYITGGVKTESGKNRIVPIHSKIYKYVEKWYNNDNEYLITNKNKKMLYRNWKDEKFGKIMEQLQMEHLPHDTRHTFATLGDNYNMNKLCIKRIMGHASKDITDKVYTHKDIEELKKEIEKIC